MRTISRRLTPPIVWFVDRFALRTGRGSRVSLAGASRKTDARLRDFRVPLCDHSVMVRSLSAVVVCAFIALTVSLQAASTGTSHHTPQGGDAATNVGDYVTSAMNSTYRYYIEVPPNQTSLQIQLFDADIGIGNAIPEDDLNRDRLRNGNDTTATYSLRNPAGVVVTPRFTSGTNALPAGADDAWLTFYGTGNSVQDDFTTAAYSNNDGTGDWAADWVETDAGGAGAGGGNVQVTGGQLQMTTNASAILRQVDLLGVNGLDLTTATLTYTFSSVNTEAGDTVVVEGSVNGGAFNNITTHTGAFGTTNASFNITGSIANNFRVRFRITGGYTAGETFNVTTIKISDGAAAPTAGHWEVRVDQPTGTAINALGIRAHDGDPTAGGTEYNVYADSFLSLGTNPDASGGASRNYILYPWVTAGCTSSQNDFDRDTDSGTVGSVVYTSRSGTFTQTITDAMFSNNNVWNRDDLINYTSNQVSSDYGIWQANSTITTYDDAEGNYETYYVGNYLVGANPPGGVLAQPYLGTGGFPAAYRIYLPTDAGTAPVKPYLQQFLTAVNGPQPAPAMGQARTYTVTVNIINPTPYSILFDASHTIVANVPGSGTVYAGSPQNPSQGSITTEPIIGGTGDVIWQPNSIAAGSNATMSYDITVTPAAATTPATGVATAGAGTRATYVDETGNTTQARATYRLGGICELNVVVGAATEVMLAEFKVDDRGHVSWITASEAGTIGFNLYREDGSKVNEHLIPAGKRIYEVDDRYVAERYILEEITASGRVNRHGPLVTGHRLGPDVTERADGPATRRRFSAEATATIAPEAAKAGVVAVMASVRETGIVRVPFSELTRLGKTADQLAKNAEKGDLLVTTGGQTVAWTSTEDALLFFGEKSDSIYSKDRVYRIELNKGGERMKDVSVGSSGAAVSIFNGQADLETDAFPVSVLPLDPESDYCFWDYVLVGDPTYGRRTFTVEVPGMASASGATMQVRLQGAVNATAHKALVRLNGVPVGDVSWADFGATTTTLTLPAGVLRDGTNEVEVEGVLDPSASYDVFFVDGFLVKYKRFAKPVGGAIEAGLTGALTAGPFNGAPLVLDITKRLRPVLLSGGSFAGGNLSMTLPSGTKTVFAAESFVSPASYRSSYEPYLSTRRGDYIVIAPASMTSGAEALASLRQKSGGKGASLKTVVAGLEQIYDEFSNGNVTPNAIRAYLASTQKWSPRPRFVVLAGTGTLDYRGLEQPAGPMPPMMISTPDGLYASDSKFADANNDGIPELAIGRIPVSTNAELFAYVDKLRDHSTSSATSPIAFTADAQDQGMDFGKASDESFLPLEGRPKRRLHVGEIGPQATRDGLLQIWQSETPLVSWIGHGGVDQLANSGILTAGDAPSLVAAGRLPVLVAMTCTINRFELGFTEALGSALTRQEDGGALAVWSATGLSNHEDARAMQRTFMKLAAENPQLKVGELIVRTLTAHPGATAGIYVLLGDPAIALELPKEITNDGPPTRTGE
jgi:hypothetical protein